MTFINILNIIITFDVSHVYVSYIYPITYIYVLNKIVLSLNDDVFNKYIFIYILADCQALPSIVK